MAPINIRGNVLDPANLEGVDLPPDASKTDYVLVQLNREMDGETLEALESHGAEVVKRMVGNNWLLHYPPSDLRVLENSIPAVDHALVYPDLFVVHSELKDGTSNSTASDGNVKVSVVLHENARSDAERALTDIQGQGNPELLTSYDGTFHMNVDRGDLERIAALDAVQAIEVVTPAKPHNDRTKEISGINSVNAYRNSIGKPTLTGDGQVVAVADTGVDADHPAFKNKIVDIYYVKGKQIDDEGHGTHVAGTVLGSPMQSWDGKDCAGMAPLARLCVQGGLFRRNADWTAQALFDRAFNVAGVNCRIHNNSWGYNYGDPPPKNPDQVAYTIDDAEGVDKFAIDHPDYLIIYAAGNDGALNTKTGAQIGAWEAAKNVLTVGASYTDRPFSGDDVVDYSPENLKVYKSHRGTVAAFSSKGPVKNTQRTKPDVVAPGVGILSARSKDAMKDLSNWPTYYGQPFGGFKATDNTIFCSGTSMAAPAVSGYAALLREALSKWQGITNPSAPLLKALFINGTDILPETSKNVQGFGEINMTKVVRPVSMALVDINSGKASSGWAQFISNKNKSMMAPQLFKAVALTPSAGKKVSLKVTLVYHDRPGDQIQNRMNLYVDRQGTKTETLPTTQFDNVHQIVIGSLTPKETVTIGVEPKLIIQGALPWAVVWDCYESA